MQFNLEYLDVFMNKLPRLFEGQLHKMIKPLIKNFYYLYNFTYLKMSTRQLNIVYPADNIDISNLNQYPSVAAPATFITDSMVRENASVTPGFIQFRKYDAYGYPYALCPGVR